MRKIVYGVMLIILALLQISFAAIINVPSEQPTIRAGIDAAVAGDTVLVADNTYSGEGNRDLSFDGKDIVVISENGPLTTILDLEGSAEAPHRAFNFINGETSEAKLIGFAIKNGYGSYSHGHNEGGAILLDGTSPTIEFCAFINNDGQWQGGAVSAFNSLSEFNNCTFTGNSAIFGGGLYSNGSQLTLNNCIIATNKTGSAVNCIYGGSFTLNCCNLFGNEGGDYVDCASGQLGVSGNISANPFFCDLYSYDFSLALNSQCLPANNSCGVLMGAIDNTCDPYLDLSVYYVYADGSGDAPTIQRALDYAGDGDTIYVGGGVYSGNGNRDLNFYGKEILLQSLEGADNTILDCQGTQAEPHRGFNISNNETRNSIIDGFSIMNGYGPFENEDNKGGAIYINSASPTIVNCKFLNNVGRRNGGAISGWNSYPLFDKCEFIANNAIHGAAIYFNGSVKADGVAEFIDCDFIDNVGLALDESYGGAVLIQHAGMTVNFERCSFIGNSAEFGGAIVPWADVSLAFTNCTFADNTCNYNDAGSAFFVYSNAQVSLENSIVAFNNGSEAFTCQGNPSLALTCCDIFGNAGGDWTGCISGLDEGDGNFSDDPLFCDLANLDIAISASSPCSALQNSCDVLIGARDIGCGQYVCGDVNSDTKVGVSDAVYIINYIFLGGAAPNPYLSGDANCDYRINITDAVYIIRYVFAGGYDPCDPDGDGIPDC